MISNPWIATVLTAPGNTQSLPSWPFQLTGLRNVAKTSQAHTRHRVIHHLGRCPSKHLPSTETILIDSTMAEALRNEEPCLRMLKKERTKAPLCVYGNALHQQSIWFADLTLLNQFFLNHASPFNFSYLRSPPISSPDQLWPPLAQPPVLQETPCTPSVPLAVIPTACLPPQRALGNTPQVEVVELCQNENHLWKGKGGRRRKGKRKKKDFL